MQFSGIGDDMINAMQMRHRQNLRVLVEIMSCSTLDEFFGINQDVLQKA